MNRFDRGIDVDAERFPYLARMQRHVDEMAACVRECEESIPFHVVTWWRARKRWKIAEAGWKEADELHHEQTIRRIKGERDG